MQSISLSFPPWLAAHIFVNQDPTVLHFRYGLIEEIMLEIQFELPDIESKTKYTVTDAVQDYKTDLPV